MSKVEKNRVKRPKTGGRQKGTPNKRTADIIERLKDEDIVGSLLDIAKTTDKEETKVTVYKELMKYVYPQRKALDATLSGEGFVVNVNNEAIEVENND